MIVVDTNVIAYLLLKGERTNEAELVLGNDPDWIAPYLWRSEFRNVLAYYIQQAYISLTDAKLIIKTAEDLMHGKEYEVQSAHVLELVKNSNCSAYDCEFVALAEQLGIKLITSDKKIITKFPDIALSMEAFVS